MRKISLVASVISSVILVSLSLAWADVDLPTKFSNQGSVGNTRHNLSQRQLSGGGPAGVTMDQYRSDYGEVCVYCHTPHGASAAQVPLWNRTIKPTAYTTYSATGSSTITQPITQPGANSLSCLSCHDGQTAVDSIINMPGSGRYQASQATSQDNAFLNTWTNPSGVGPGTHMSMNNVGCLACHAPGSFVGAGATDFTAFVIGTDLRDDHPVGIRYPTTGPNVDFKATTATFGTMKFFDTNGNTRPDTNEIRLYDTGGVAKVECASCHDPHGVPSGGAGSVFIASFLRVSNAGSTLCLSCHVK